MPIFIPLTGQQTLTVADTAVSLTIPDRANAAIITVEQASIRWWDTGTAPTSTTGHLAPPGTQIIYSDTGDRTLLENFQAIRVTDVSGTIQVSYYVYRSN